MIRRSVLALAVVGGTIAGTTLLAQQPRAITGAQFDVVSIKPNKSGEIGGGMRDMPDGGFQATNIRIRQIMNAAAPEPVFDITGLPDWVLTERYDIAAKPAPDSHPTREQRNQMMHNMMIEHFKVSGHVQDAERDGFALVVERSDGRLGPQLKKSALDCAGADGPRCNGRMATGRIDFIGTRMDGLARSLTGVAGGPVSNRTGLEGFYDVTLRYSARSLNANPDALPGGIL